ncbi:MAG: secondary thiamine-phosphate synthase enzyme YjbQ [Candidatus Eisenbacteria bacterium]|nr:secondary thiamine-phosphate synthase enzyme YjbQ [Candidatus Eisenbacteria bacterium]
MEIRTHRLEVPTRGFCDIVDVTPQIRDLVRGEGLKEGSLLLFMGGATAGVTTIEFEPGAVGDLRAALERIAPTSIPYAHDARWGDGNGFSHVRAALLKASLEIPVSEGELLLGTWQQAVVCDFDNRPRRREFVCQLRGIFSEAGSRVR